MLLMSFGVFESSSLRSDHLKGSKMGDYWRQVHTPNENRPRRYRASMTCADGSLIRRHRFL
jgi:hypothetical protein